MEAVNLGIFDAAGRRVATLHHRATPAGRYDVAWDGRDTSGRRVPAGIYFARFVADAFQQSRRIVLVH